MENWKFTFKKGCKKQNEKLCSMPEKFQPKKTHSNNLQDIFAHIYIPTVFLNLGLEKTFQALKNTYEDGHFILQELELAILMEIWMNE